MIDDKQLHEAIDRIARSEDGKLLYRYLQKVLCGVISIQAGDNEGALRHDHGRRSFASELMGLMSKGISDSERTTAVTFTVARASRVSGSRGAGRRVSADTTVSGWDSAADTTGPSSGQPS